MKNKYVVNKKEYEMGMISTGKGWDEPGAILSEMKNPIHEMSDEQHSFLCALIKERNPQKLVEIGVAEGGTTAVIMKALELSCPESTMFSVDLNKELYYDASKCTGYLLDEVKNKLSNFDRHTFLTGKYLPEVIDKIGDGIDFVILDTVHFIPGEYLDFLCILPYLKDEAIVLFHDITLGTSNIQGRKAICTATLFNSIMGKKIWNYDNVSADNLGAVIINQTTRDNIDNVIASLYLPWEYIPNEYEISLYTERYREYFSENEFALFQCAYMKQKKMWERIKIEQEEFIWQIISNFKISEKSVFIYGNGNYGNRLKTILNKFEIEIKSFVISDDQNIDDYQKDNTIYLRDYDEEVKDNFLIYAIKDRSALYNLIKKGIRVFDLPNEFWGE